MPPVAVNGVRLNVERAGQGMPLVLLHGFAGSAATWAPHLVTFSRHFATVAVDLLGHGASDAPADPARYRMERCVADLLALFDRLALGRPAVLGYSMGGRVTLHLAIAAPKRVGALVLESVSPGIAEPGERAARVERDTALADTIEREGIVAFVDHWERLPLFASQSTLPAAVRDRQRTQRLASDPRGLANSLRGMGAGAMEPLTDRLDEIAAPTLLIVGEFDDRYRDVGCTMAAMPRTRLAIVPGSGHAVHLEQPDAFDRIVLEFLQGKAYHDTADSPGLPGRL